MFGYVRIRKPELKIKDYDCYHRFYCGLCHCLKKQYGLSGQMTLTYDMTFLVILLSSLYEPEIEMKSQHCIVHPARKHLMSWNEVTRYGADMNVLLGYYNFRDKWEDDRSVKGKAGMMLYQKKGKRAANVWKRKGEQIRCCLEELSAYEKEEGTDPEQASGYFGRLLEELFVLRHDSFEKYLRCIGYHLGCFIYLMDAYDDLEDDIRTGSFNPLKNWKGEPDFEEKIYRLLLREMETAASAFEMLPCVEYQDLLRNIIYAGVWNRYDDIWQRKEKNADSG